MSNKQIKGLMFIALGLFMVWQMKGDEKKDAEGDRRVAQGKEALMQSKVGV